jgi:hypothetical protein
MGLSHALELMAYAQLLAVADDRHLKTDVELPKSR